MKAHLILAALAALLLTACDLPPARPTAVPTAPPTAAPSTAAPTGAPTTAPTAATSYPGPGASPTAGGATIAPTPATPVAGPGLPAPLYLLQAGQIVKIERDGVTRAVLTAESVNLPDVEPITEFAVLPTGDLAYIVGDAESDRLMLADGSAKGARILYQQQGHELSDLVATPDGEALMLRLLNNRQPPDLPSGVYRLPLGGGDPVLLRADDPVDDPVNPARTVSGYRPLAFAPGGSRLLLQVFSLFYEDCGLGVIAASGGEVVRLSLPAGESVYCGEEAWAADGGSVLFLAGKAQGDDAGPRLWRADATTGAPEPLAAAGAFARAPQGMAGGAVRFFRAEPIRDQGGAVTGARFAPAELTAPGATPADLGPAFEDRLNLALWAPDGAGVVVETSDAEGRSSVRWLPIGAAAADLPAADATVAHAAWGQK